MLAGKAAHLDPMVERCQVLLRADLRREWTAETLSHALQVSPSTLYRLFKRALAIPPLTWYKRLRMTTAAERLRDPHLQAIADLSRAEAQTKWLA